jgi:glutathione S-transferase
MWALQEKPKESELYRLYYYPVNASMALHFVLEALKVDFELILVDRKSNAQKSDEYLALNPSKGLMSQNNISLILILGL